MKNILDNLNVIKRNFKQEKFDIEKLFNSIITVTKKAWSNKWNKIFNNILNEIKNHIDKNDNSITSNELWDLIEIAFMKELEYEASKIYITYRIQKRLEEKEFNNKNIFIIKNNWKKEKFDIKKIKKNFNRLSKEINVS